MRRTLLSAAVEPNRCQTKPRVPHPSAFFALGWETMLPTRLAAAAKKLCHPDRSEAQWRDLAFCMMVRNYRATGSTVMGRARLQPSRYDPDEDRASAPEGPTHATEKKSAPKIESQ